MNRLCLRIVVPAALVVGALALPAASTADSDGLGHNCPDHYKPVPVVLVQSDKDKNNDQFVCAKEDQGANNHTNLKDDKFDPTSQTMFNETDDWALWMTGYMQYSLSSTIDDTTTP